MEIAVALDHYVSQVHLKNFYSPLLVNRMFAIRKRDLKRFTPDAHSVCRINDGSTNLYLQEPRAIEEFLRTIEPNYNEAVARVAAGTFDNSTIYVIAGYISYLLTCSPAAIRLNSVIFQSVTEATSRVMDEEGKFSPPPQALGAASLSDLFDQGRLKIDVDPKYPQAVGISSVLSTANTFGNFRWEVLINNDESNPFFSSDFPVGLQTTLDPRILIRVVPLSPRVAIRITPDIDIEKGEPDFKFERFRGRVTNASRAQVHHVNRSIVQCAEELIFFPADFPWVEKFVRKNAGYRLENRAQRIPLGRGTLILSALEIAKIS